jgi:hypothetical protein
MLEFGAGKQKVRDLGFLKAQNVRLIALDKSGGQLDPRADRIDVPGCDA